MCLIHQVDDLILGLILESEVLLEKFLTSQYSSSSGLTPSSSLLSLEVHLLQPLPQHIPVLPIFTQTK